MSLVLCQPTTYKQEEHSRRRTRLLNNWMNTKGPYKNISKRFVDKDIAERGIKDLAEEWLDLPYTKDFYLTEKQWAKLDILSEKFNKRIAGTWSNGLVPSATMLNDPAAIRFEKQLDAATHFERTQLSKNHEYTLEISKSMKEAFIENMLQGKNSLGIKFVKDLRKLNNKALREDNDVVRRQYYGELKKLYDHSDGGKLMNQFKELVSASNSEFNILSKSGDYNLNVINASTRAREQMNYFGNTLKKTLKGGPASLMNVLNAKYDIAYIGKDRKYNRVANEVDAAIKRIDESIKRGGYMPEIMFEGVIKLKTRMDDLMAARTKSEVREMTDVLSQTLGEINLSKISDRAKPRNEVMENLYLHDPMHVLDQYGKEIVMLNHINTLQSAYLEGIKTIPKSDLKFINGLRKFMDDQYTIASKGYTDRPDWVNDATRFMGAFQIARTMGFNLTGSIKNLSSVSYYIAEMGRSKLKEISSLMKNNKKLRDEWAKVSQDEAMIFPDIGRELIAEGLIKQEGINTSDFSYDPMSNKITYKGGDAKKWLQDKVDWSVDKALVFQRFTENALRGWMYKMAFGSKYMQLMKNPGYVKELTGDSNINLNAAARKFSKNYSLNMVNRYAYEYAIHAKSNWIRGNPGQKTVIDGVANKDITGDVLKGAAKQASFQLMHYPMSLINTHIQKAQRAGLDWKAGSRTGESIADKFTSHEMAFFGRYAVIFGGLQLASVAMNINFNRIVDNAVINEMKELHDNMLLYDDKDERTYGLLGQFTGPMISQAQFALQMAGIIDNQSSDLSKILLGNIDYEDKETEKYKWYQASTIVGQTVNKTWPSIKDGRGWDVFRHIFNAYPSKETKKYNKMFFEDVLGVKKKKKKKALTNADRAALSVVDRMLAGR